MDGQLEEQGELLPLSAHGRRGAPARVAGDDLTVTVME